MMGIVNRSRDVFYAAETAIIESFEIGEDTKVWHFSHVSKGAKIGKNCTIGEGVYIGPNVTIGDNCKIQNHAQIFEGVTIGDECFIGPCVCFTNDRYPQDQKWWEQGWHFEAEKTTIGNRVAIGANSTIICGVVIYDNSFIGAGSVVTKSINGAVKGNPAR